MKKPKRIEGLDCDAAAREGMALVLRAKLEEICQLRDAALDFSDIEGVHKMRVASRRLRSALRDFQPYLSETVSPNRLKAVARALGAVRDEDVALEMMGKLLAEADAEADEVAREGFERVAAARRARREKARARLAKAVGDVALARLRGKFNAQLDRAAAAPRMKNRRGAREGAGEAEATPDAEATSDAAAPAPSLSSSSPLPSSPCSPSTAEPRFTDAGGEIVGALFRELKESGPSLYRPFEVEPLHRMRIKAKRLRYAIELFAQCWGEPVAPYASEIAKLQQHLGELHDCDVWIEDLGSRLGRGARAKPRAGRASGEVSERRAAAWLLRHFADARARHYARALALWDNWESMDFASSLAASVEEARGRRPPPAHEAGAADAAGKGGPAEVVGKDGAAKVAEGSAEGAVGDDGAGVADQNGAAGVVDKDGAARAVDGDGAPEVADDTRAVQA